MKYYNVLISKEAGVYVAEETIEAKNSKEAEVIAMDMAESDQVKWEYSEVMLDDPLIQVEEVSQVPILKD